MSKIYFTITGTKYRYGSQFLKPGQKVRLKKEPDNPYDREAVKVELKGLGLIGYVANSPYTVLGESWSAGRLYDKIGDTAKGTVLYVLEKGVICTLNPKSLLKKECSSSSSDNPPFEFIESVTADADTSEEDDPEEQDADITDLLEDLKAIMDQFSAK